MTDAPICFLFGMDEPDMPKPPKGVPEYIPSGDAQPARLTGVL